MSSGNVGKVIDVLLTSGAHTATQYVSEKLTVRATRRMFGPKGRRRFNGKRATDVVLTIGVPNFKARAFIKAAKKAGERFPIRKIQLAFPTS